MVHTEEKQRVSNMIEWNAVKCVKKMPVLKNPVLIEGMPGIGNVGKVAVDFIVDELNAKKIYDLQSYSLPHSVFVNDKNLVEMPAISLYAYKNKEKGNDFLFLVGDVQPIDEKSTYLFCECVLDIATKFNCSLVITLGGIGLPKIPVSPKVYLAGNDAKACKQFEKIKGIQPKLYGVVGPIIGVSGVLLGLAKRRSLLAVSLLAETSGSPMYLGIKGSREIIRILLRKFSFSVDASQLDKEIKKTAKLLEQEGKNIVQPQKKNKQISYIG